MTIDGTNEALKKIGYKLGASVLGSNFKASYYIIDPDGKIWLMTVKEIENLIKKGGRK